MSTEARKKASPEIKLKRYHALLDRISKLPEVGVTSNEHFSLKILNEYYPE